MLEKIFLWNNVRFMISLAIQFYAVYLVLCIVFGKEQIAPKKLLVMYSLLTLVMVIGFILRVGTIINYVIGPLGIMAGAIFYKGNKIKYIFVAAALSIVIIILELGSGILLAFIGNNFISIIRTENQIVNIVNMLSNLLPLILVMIYYRLHTENQSREDTKLPLKSIMQLCIIPLLSGLSILLVWIIALNSSIEVYPLIITLLGFIIVICISFIRLYNKVAVNEKLRYEASLNNVQNKYYIALYENSKKEQQNTLEFQHNIKHNLLGIKGLLEEENILDALIELDQIIDIKSEVAEIFCNIGVIDAVINYNLHKAKQAQVTITTKTDIYSSLKVNGVYIANILGNLLDNALEACRHNMLAINKVINLSLVQQRSALFIVISNPYEQEIKMSKGLPLSSKRDFASSGIGLNSIKNLITQHKGTFNLTIENNKFSVEIILYDCMEI